MEGGGVEQVIVMVFLLFLPPQFQFPPLVATPNIFLSVSSTEIFDGSSQDKRMNAVLKEVVVQMITTKNFQKWVFNRSILGLIQFAKVPSLMEHVGLSMGHLLHQFVYVLIGRCQG